MYSFLRFETQQNLAFKYLFDLLLLVSDAPFLITIFISVMGDFA